MNTIKRIAGIAWIILGPVAIYYLLVTASAEISKKPSADTKIQWIAFITILVPIALGFVLFGYYALKGEYDQADKS